jgi:Two component regulator propeller
VRRGLPALAALAFGAALEPGLLHAAAVRIWVTDSAAEFSLGEARGIAVGSNGSLSLGRNLVKVEGVSEPVLFGAAPAKGGDVLVATGDSGVVLRVSEAGKSATEVKLEEQEVTAVAEGPDGALYAGGSPGGKVYRIQKGKATVYYDTKAQYVWALAFDGPVLYVGTGLPGEIHRVAPGGKGEAGKGERLHSTTDAHVRSLYVDPQGRIWAGTSGSGLLLRIDKTGRVATVYDSAKTETTSITGDRSGRVWAAFASSESPSSSSSSEPISLPAPLAASKAPRSGGPGEDDDHTKAEVSVSVSAPRLATGRGNSRGGFSSEVVVFDGSDLPRTVWTSSDEIVFDLARDIGGDGVLAGTGPRGKLYAIAPETWALARTFDEKQVTLLAGGDVGTNGPTALYRPSPGPATGEYVSAVKDTGRTSRFGAFRYEGEVPNGARLEFAFRSGESSTPDATWSPWSAWENAAPEIEIPAPEGRFLQWKARMSGREGVSPAVRRVEASYRNRNATPTVDALSALEPAEVLARSGSGGANVFESSTPDERGIFTGLEEPRSEGSPRKLFRKGFRTLQWKASDPDGDTLVYEIEFRPASGGKWVSLRKELRETFYSFDSTSLPDGEYIFRVTASDAESNPGEARSSSRDTSPVRIDNTPPVIRELSRSSGVLEFEAVDSASPILEAEYSIDAKKWVKIEPKDGLSDSPREAYAIRLPADARGAYLLVRVTDSARNVGSASFVAP